MRSGIALAALLFVTACGGSSDADPEQSDPESAPTIEVSAALIASNVNAIAAEVLDDDSKPPTCEEMTGDYEALRVGEQAKLMDADGETVAVASLETSPLKMEKNVCLWDAKFVDVPTGGRFYSVTIGKWESDAVPESEVTSKTIVINTAS